MKFIELFAGIGGFRLGLQKAGHECVYANEWLQKPASIYEYNFGEKPDTSDVRTIDPFSIPDADLICGGFPCATFSIAGKREGIYGADTRGTLFFEICRIAEAKRTPYLFLENVKGLLNHDNGKTFAVILLSLDKLGYDVQWELLNSRNFGVPQNRERIFIIANLRGYPRPKVFPLGRCGSEIGLQNTEEQNKREGVQGEIDSPIEVGTLCNRLYGGDTNNFYLESGVAGAVDAHCYKGGSTRTHVESEITVRPVLTPKREEKRQNGRRFKDDGEDAFTLGVQDIHGIMITEATQKGYTIAEEGDGVNLQYPDSETRRGLVIKGTAHTLMAASVNSVVHKSNIRQLTPMECERLQGFPDNWTKYYADGSKVSDKERYERCGRTVTIPVIEEIGKRLNNFY